MYYLSTNALVREELTSYKEDLCKFSIAEV